jgi:hypothetical protein
MTKTVMLNKNTEGNKRNIYKHLYKEYLSKDDWYISALIQMTLL